MQNQQTTGGSPQALSSVAPSRGKALVRAVQAALGRTLLRVSWGLQDSMLPLILSLPCFKVESS